MNQQLPALLFYYGLFLIICGVISVIFIGMKAKTALVSGGVSGTVAIVCGHFVAMGVPAFQSGGILLSLMLLIVFSWRSTKTLFRIFELLGGVNPELLSVKGKSNELKSKGIAFLIISLMAVLSIVVLTLQLVWL